MSAQSFSERFEMRLSPSVLEELDAWRSRQPDLPSRSEAARHLIESGLARDSEKEVRLSAGEKLILLALRDLFKHIKIKDGETDLDFIAQVIFGGHSWAFPWQLPGVFHNDEASRTVVSEVVQILDMWSLLESSYQNFSKDDKARVAEECQPLGKDVSFRGFDGNNEGEHMSVANFLINELDRFTVFKGRGLNAHTPTIDTHRRMLAVFEPLKQNLMGRTLNVDEVIDILQARVHPSRRRSSRAAY